MPTFKGTAASAEELLDVIKDSLVDAATMGVEAWDVMRYNETTGELILKGPGTKKEDGSRGTDEIYVGIQLKGIGTTSRYLVLNGFTGYDPLLKFNDQPGYIPQSQVKMQGTPIVPLICSSMHYWIVANGRRFVVVIRIGTRYEAFYLGLLKPYADAGQFPYPLVVGGSMTGMPFDAGTATFNYSMTREDSDHRHFIDPGSVRNGLSSLRMRRHDGSWANFCNKTSSLSYLDVTAETVSPNKYSTWPYQNPLSDLLPNMDDTYTLFPTILYEKIDGRPQTMFGELDGCYWVSGQVMGPEDTITIDTSKYLVVINVYRNKPGDYWALKMD